MIACVALLVGAVTGSTDSFRPEVALEVLDTALVKAWTRPDPRDLVASVLRTATEIDPKRASNRVQAAAERLRKLSLPPRRRDVLHSLAEDVAPLDPKLRDELLRLAITDARKALAEKALWKAPPRDPDVIPFGDPQSLIDQEKQILAFQVRLWESVVKRGEDNAAARRLVELLLADAKAKGFFGSDAPARYDYYLCRNLANLDPSLVLAVLPKIWGKKSTADFCGSIAYDRWVDRRRDSFTGLLAKYAVESGVRAPHVFEVFGHYDLDGAWAIAEQMPDEPTRPDSPRRTILSHLIVDLAWRDPEAALAAAEKEPDALTRRGWIDQVARVWAYKKPDQIERAIRNQDNELRRQWTRDAAAEELEWRRKGNPPRDTRDKLPPRFRHMTPEERKKAGRPKAHPDVIRVVENPADTEWLKGPERSHRLHEAAQITYVESGNLDGVLMIARSFNDPDEADQLYSQLAEAISRAGPPPHAVRLLAFVKSPYRSVMTSCLVARGLVRAPEFGR